MHESFVIQVAYQGNEQEFKARFERWGYTHRIAVLVGETTFTFEPDEEGVYRALTTLDKHDSLATTDANLLEAIAKKIAAINS
jgi:hypothetical protein